MMYSYDVRDVCLALDVFYYTLLPGWENSWFINTGEGHPLLLLWFSCTL